MGTGGGGAEIANMEIFTKNFQHFSSKNLSDGAFFNVIGSRMDANVIKSNGHQHAIYVPSIKIEYYDHEHPSIRYYDEEHDR